MIFCLRGILVDRAWVRFVSGSDVSRASNCHFVSPRPPCPLQYRHDAGRGVVVRVSIYIYICKYTLQPATVQLSPQRTPILLCYSRLRFHARARNHIPPSPRARAHLLRFAGSAGGKVVLQAPGVWHAPEPEEGQERSG